jgi:hypothetical protein
MTRRGMVERDSEPRKGKFRGDDGAKPFAAKPFAGQRFAGKRSGKPRAGPWRGPRAPIAGRPPRPNADSVKPV